MNRVLFPHSQIIICGDPQGEDTRQLLQCVHTHYLPNKVLILTDEGQTSGFLSSCLDILKTLQRIDGKATVYVCENYQCQLPVNSVDDLADLLKK